MKSLLILHRIKVENANAEQFRKASGDIVRRCNHALHHIANTVGDFRATNEIEDCQS